MELRTLRAFVAVAEEGSINAAARRLFLAQPALSRQVAMLERQLGIVLFERRPTGVALTSAGAVFLMEARQLTESADRLVHDAKRLSSGAHYLRIGMSGEGLGVLQPIIAEAFRAACPGVKLAITDAGKTVLDRVLEGQLDGSFWSTTALGDEFDATPAYSEPRVLLVSRRHPLADATELRVNDVLNERFMQTPGLYGRVMAPYVFARERGNEPPSRREAESKFADPYRPIAAGRFVVTVTPGSLPFIPTDVPIAAVPIIDAPRTTIGLAVRAGARSEPLDILRDVVARVGQSFAHLTPGARPVNSDSDESGLYSLS